MSNGGFDMAQRYNPPPNWPQPPAGWVPPAGWQPDPAWGPAPPGHQVWVDEDAAPKKPRPWGWIAAVALAFFIGLGIGAAGGGGDDTTTTATSGDEPAPTVTATKEVAGPVTTETVTAEPAGPEDTIDEGVWEVGGDVRPGRYKIIEPITGDCYYQISPIGNPGEIIDNGIPTGGRPTVTLKRGQEFTNQGCGIWGRQ